MLRFPSRLSAPSPSLRRDASPPCVPRRRRISACWAGLHAPFQGWPRAPAPAAARGPTAFAPARLRAPRSGPCRARGDARGQRPAVDESDRSDADLPGACACVRARSASACMHASCAHAVVQNHICIRVRVSVHEHGGVCATCSSTSRSRHPINVHVSSPKLVLDIGDMSFHGSCRCVALCCQFALQRRLSPGAISTHTRIQQNQRSATHRTPDRILETQMSGKVSRIARA